MTDRRWRAATVVTLGLTASLLGGCVVHQLPACDPPQPGGIVVSENEPSPPLGMGRVRLESDPPAAVYRSKDARPALADAVKLCASTPCTVMLPFGDHDLTLVGHHVFARDTATVVVHVDAADTAVRVHLEHRHYSSGVFAGLAIAGAGATTSFVGLLSAGSGRSDTGKAFDALALVGLVPLVVGIVITATSSTTLREGSATQWNPKLTAASDGFSLRF